MFHNDKHVIKMILEYSQLLSTAHRVLDGKQVGKSWQLPDIRESVLYKATHINHPSAIWARDNKENYSWLSLLLKRTCREYTYRYGKIHATEQKNLPTLLSVPPNNIKNGFFYEPTVAMPDDCKIDGDAVSSYRKYYMQEKRHIASWQGKINSRRVPNWYK